VSRKTVDGRNRRAGEDVVVVEDREEVEETGMKRLKGIFKVHSILFGVFQKRLIFLPHRPTLALRQNH
jgi:hypothetical protein